MYVVKVFPKKIVASLIMSKSKVVPTSLTRAVNEADTATDKKAITIVRLELLAAVLCGRLGAYVAMTLGIDEAYYFSDSTITLSRIRKDARSWKQWIGNRLLDIQQNTKSPDNWYWVDTLSNPADLVSRGCSVDELIASSLWWNGPPMLLQPMETWKRGTSQAVTQEERDNALRFDFIETMKNLAVIGSVNTVNKLEDNSVLVELMKMETHRTVVK